MTDKSELIEDYIGLTFPYQIRDVLENQEILINQLVEINEDNEEVDKQKGILNILLSKNFQESLREVMREGLDRLTKEELGLAVLHEQTMRKMDIISSDVGEKFNELLSATSAGDI